MASTARSNVAAATQTGASAQELNGTAAALQSAVARFVLTPQKAGTARTSGSSANAGKNGKSGTSKNSKSSTNSKQQNRTSDDDLATAGSTK